MVENKGISIWFFIGVLLLAYGIIITASSIAETAFHAFGRHVVLQRLNFGIWWGFLLIIVGLIYSVIFRPWKNKKSEAAGDVHESEKAAINSK
ncbi:MAG: hypothetical protein WAO19_10350 [Candidatus Kryptoniota bacterium]